MNLYPWLMPYYQQTIQPFTQGMGHHALLFRAEQELGTAQLIEQLAGWLMCQQPQGEQACGHCHSCQLYQAQNHPDFYHLTSIDGKDIGVDQVREINEKVSQHAQQNGNKVVFIDGAERLTESAANALLKTLEEPRPNTYFLLLADLSSPLMATIYSRCQVRVINVPEQAVASQWLQAQCPDKTQEIATALLINYGRPLAALDCLREGLVEKRRAFLRQFWLFYLRRSPLELLPEFDKDLLFQQIDWLLAFLEDSLKYKLNIRQGWICEDLARGVQQFSEKQTAQGLLKANEIIQKVRLDLSQINGVNQELILLDGLTRLITDVFEGK